MMTIDTETAHEARSGGNSPRMTLEEVASWTGWSASWLLTLLPFVGLAFFSEFNSAAVLGVVVVISVAVVALIRVVVLGAGFPAAGVYLFVGTALAVVVEWMCLLDASWFPERLTNSSLFTCAAILLVGGAYHPRHVRLPAGRAVLLGGLTGLQLTLWNSIVVWLVAQDWATIVLFIALPMICWPTGTMLTLSGARLRRMTGRPRPLASPTVR